MYLRTLEVRNFRSCYDTTVELQSDITLLVGENNSGKSNIIEALRLSTAPLNPRTKRWFEESDRSHGRDASDVEFTTTFDGLTQMQRALYTTALDTGTSRVIYGTLYKAGQGIGRKAKPTLTAGPAGGADAEQEQREDITHVYLAPLRDAQRALDSADNNRLMRVIQQLTSKEDQDAFLDEANKAFGGLKEHGVLTQTSGAIQAHLDRLTLPVRGQQVEVTFQDYELNRLTRSLRVKMAEHGIEPADLAESGLGYANLLFIATVILELRNAQDAELTLFLVEEPEAHLHPQLQAVLLEYLREQAGESVRDDSSGKAGRIQVVATTHSTNLASTIGIEKVVSLRTVREADASVGEDGQPQQVSRRMTKAIPLASLPLDESERRKINQYLDATRAGLLFARRVLLVEGVAEAVLLPVLAKHCVLAGESKQDQQRRRDFLGVTIVNVGSVDFAPYVKLLLSGVEGCRLLDKLVVITDGDPALPEDEKDKVTGGEVASEASPTTSPADPTGAVDDADDDEEDDDDDDEAEAFNRREHLMALAQSLAAGQQLYVAEAPHTLEADLITPAGNAAVLGAAYLKQKTRSQKQWQAIATAEDPAFAFYRKLRKTKKLIGKGEFAHDVATAIMTGEAFEAPAYLRDAILAVLGDGAEATGAAGAE